MKLDSCFHIGQRVYLGLGRDQIEAVVTALCFRGGASSEPSYPSVEVVWFAGGNRNEMWIAEHELASYNFKEDTA